MSHFHSWQPMNGMFGHECPLKEVHQSGVGPSLCLESASTFGNRADISQSLVGQLIAPEYQQM
jgi:hypothetical protein